MKQPLPLLNEFSLSLSVIVLLHKYIFIVEKLHKSGKRKAHLNPFSHHQGEKKTKANIFKYLLQDFSKMFYILPFSKYIIKTFSLNLEIQI